MDWVSLVKERSAGLVSAKHNPGPMDLNPWTLGTVQYIDRNQLPIPLPPCVWCGFNACGWSGAQGRAD